MLEFYVDMNQEKQLQQKMKIFFEDGQLLEGKSTHFECW